MHERSSLYVKAVFPILPASFPENEEWDSGIFFDKAEEIDLSGMSDRTYTYLDHASRIVLAGVLGVIEEAGWQEAAAEAFLAIGTASGCLRTLERHHETVKAGKGRFVSPFLFSHAYPNTPSALASMETGTRRSNYCFVGESADAAALQAAFLLVESGCERRGVVGGVCTRKHVEGGFFLAVEDDPADALFCVEKIHPHGDDRQEMEAAPRIPAVSFLLETARAGLAAAKGERIRVGTTEFECIVKGVT